MRVSELFASDDDMRWSPCTKCGCSEFRLLYEYSYGIPLDLLPVCAECGFNEVRICVNPKKELEP